MISFIITITFLITVVIGVIAGKEIRNKKENFYVAGRSWSWVLVGFALMAQAIDGNSTLGGSSLGFDFGFWTAASLPIGLALSLFLIGKFFAPKLNSMKLLTLSDFFRIKYDRKIEIIASLLMLLSFGILLAGNIAAVALLVLNFIPIYYQTAVILICLVILLYCLFGGIIADLYSDIWQMALLVVGMILTLSFVIYKFDFTNLLSSQIFTDSLNLNQLFTIQNGGLINFATIIALGFGNILAIDFNSRIFAAKSEDSARKGSYLGAFLTLAIGLPFAFLPIIIKYLDIALVDGSPILLTFAHSILPEFVTGVLISGIIAVSLSTIDGAMLSMGNIITQNLLRIEDDLANVDSSESEKTFLYFSRFSLIPIACIAMIFAMLLPSPGILLTVSFDIMFASLLAPFVFGFYLKKPNALAAIYAICTGFIVRLLFAILTPTSFGLPNEIFYIENSFLTANFDGLGTIIAPICSFAIYAIIYVFTKNSSPKITN